MRWCLNKINSADDNKLNPTNFYFYRHSIIIKSKKKKRRRRRKKKKEQKEEEEEERKKETHRASIIINFIIIINICGRRQIYILYINNIGGGWRMRRGFAKLFF
jgi:hypothetical protein